MQCLSIVPVMAGGTGTPAVCFNWESLSNYEVQHLDSTARSILAQISNLQRESVWRQSDIVFRATMPLERFAELTNSLAERLGNTANLQAAGGILVKSYDQHTKTVMIECGKEGGNTANRVQIQLWPGVTKTAVLYYRQEVGLVNRIVVVVLAQRDTEQYRLLSLYLAPYSFIGNDAASFADEGENAIGKNRLLAGYWFYQCALLLAQAGPVVQNGAALDLRASISALRQNPDFQKTVNSIRINGWIYPVYTYYFVEMNDRIVPLVAYLTRYEISGKDKKTADKIEAEATLLCRELLKNNADFFEVFPEVMFQAYFEPPRDAQKQYPFFKVMLNTAEIQ